MSKQPQQPAVTGTGQTRGHTSASPRYCASASPRENSYPVMQRPRSPAFARTTAWLARPQLMHCMSFRMPGSYTRSPDSATTSALTSFPGFANRAASFRTVRQAARKRCLPGLRYARYYLRGVAAAGMHNLVIAQTNFPSLSSREYQPHCSLTASTSISPRPCSASSPASVRTSVRTGGRGLASHTRIRICAESDSSHSRTAETRPASREALIAFVISSVTRSSALSPRFPIPHSHSTCLACRRAQGTALTRAPSSRKS